MQGLCFWSVCAQPSAWGPGSITLWGYRWEGAIFTLLSVPTAVLWGTPDPSTGRWQGQAPWGQHQPGSQQRCQASRWAPNSHGSLRPLVPSPAFTCKPQQPCMLDSLLLSHVSHPRSLHSLSPAPSGLLPAAWTAAEQPAAAVRLAGGRDPFFNFSRSFCATPVGSTPARLSASRARLYFSISPQLTQELCSLSVSSGSGGYLGTTQDQP